MRVTTIGWMVLAALSCAAPAQARDYEQLTGTAADGTRFYQDSIAIRAPLAKVWAAFTDQTSFRAWAAPISAVDFRIGGAIEASYDPRGHLGDPQNIKNQFIAYIPERLLVFRNVQAPDGLPGKEVYGDTVKTIEFASTATGEVRVTVSGIGFGEGAAFDRLYGFFANGDGDMLVTLKKAMETPQH